MLRTRTCAARSSTYAAITYTCAPRSRRESRDREEKAEIEKKKAEIEKKKAEIEKKKAEIEKKKAEIEKKKAENKKEILAHRKWGYETCIIEQTGRVVLSDEEKAFIERFDKT
jgi:septal ring factor EnvC (AmiA/AmiB activator)